jgi:demethylmenaquinone methyltransferase/2-methoxy-6-polyprenyl-1,4-benzoquinol methylase
LTDKHQATRANYDRLSRWYDLFSGSGERPARECGLHMLDIQDGERILEIGCGTGESLLMLTSYAGSAKCIFGLDLSAGMLRRAKSKLKWRASLNVTLMQGDAYQLPFADETFDAIFMSFTLELFPTADIPVVLQECRRVLRLDGRMGIVSLLQKEDPNWMERSYTWAHRRWPNVIDCRPISIEEVVKSAHFDISGTSEMTMWGLAVGIFIASKQNYKPGAFS